MTLKIITFGCRLNTYETEVIRKFLDDNEKFRDKNVTIFNSCVVTSEAEKQLRQAIRKAKKEKPESIIGIIGCAVQVNPEVYKNMPEVNFIIDNSKKMDKKNYSCLSLNHTKKDIIVGNILELAELSPQLITGFEERTRAFIQIQNGCDNHCTFCATRLARGKSVSIQPKSIIEQINKLVDNNYNEIVLTGVDITDYGKRLDENINLGKLIKKIITETNLQRLRLSSVDIADMNDSLKDMIFNEPRVMPHVHISLQSGDDTILKRMNRRHNRADVINFAREFRKYRKDAAIGADLIAGFPTETEEMHRNSAALIEEINLTFGHIFPYSVREGTIAAKMEQVPMNTRRKRAAELREFSDKNLKAFLKSQVGKNHKVLVESDSVGRTENYLTVELNGKYNVGNIVDLKTTSENGKSLIVCN